MTYRFRYLDDADRERWPDWYEVDAGAMDDMDTGVLLDWEDATGYRSLAPPDDPRSITAAMRSRDLKALLAMQWLAVRLAGVDVAWRDFRPKALHVDVDRAAAADEPEEKPVDPPARARRAPSGSAAATSKPRRRAPASRPSGKSSPTTTS